MRPATACHSCRVSKRKCHPNPNGATIACARCHRQQLVCSFITLPSYSPVVSPVTPSRNRDARFEGQVRHGQALTSPSLSPRWPGGVDAALRDEMIEHYFTVVHDTHHSLFHRPTLEVEIRSGKAADVVQYAILSLGSRFIRFSDHNGLETRRLSEELAEKAHRSLDIRDVSITTVQGCILLGTLCYADGRGAAEAVYYATAARLAIILDLPRRPCSTELERQLNLRVWWTLYMIDIWSSAGLQLSRQLSYQEEAELPMDELGFSNLRPDTLHDGRQSRIVGIWGEMARLSYIWSLIQDLNKNSVEQNLPPMSLTSAIDGLAQQLTAWRDALPAFLQESPENLRHMAKKGLGTTFAALHLGYHYYHEVLFYQYMAESHQTPSSRANKYAAECARHARAFCNLVYLCERTEGCRCLYAMVGHMLVVTSTVYVHMLLFNAPVESPSAATNTDARDLDTLRCRLEHNFEILTNLQTHWTTLDVSVARLRVFHNACLYSMEHSFRMDKWMLRFIMEHGASMPEKFEISKEGQEGEATFGEGDGSLQDWYTRALR